MHKQIPHHISHFPFGNTLKIYELVFVDYLCISSQIVLQKMSHKICNKICIMCNKDTDDQYQFGKKITVEDVTVHYFCLVSVIVGISNQTELKMVIYSNALDICQIIYSYWVAICRKTGATMMESEVFWSMTLRKKRDVQRVGLVFKWMLRQPIYRVSFDHLLSYCRLVDIVRREEVILAVVSLHVVEHSICLVVCKMIAVWSFLIVINRFAIYIITYKCRWNTDQPNHVQYVPMKWAATISFNQFSRNVASPAHGSTKFAYKSMPWRPVIFWSVPCATTQIPFANKCQNVAYLSPIGK